ncbi:MAG: hypothetical protein JNM93_13340 [Bacteriovoracaceae bacterium]|nr:hypothetical protein [Bacteriovoracaceae bacterium]
MKILFSLFFALIVTSCSNVHYRFREKSSYPVKFTGEPREKREVSFELKREFLLWGLSPKQQEVIVDEEVEKAGYSSLSRLIIYERRTTQDIVLSIITFGFYNPRTIVITGFTE